MGGVQATERRLTRSQKEISGGNIYDCLSGTDIDQLMAPLLGERYVPAIELYDVRTGRSSADVTYQKLLRRLRSQSIAWCFAPLHVRHHWCTAIFSLHQDRELKLTVLDSAPSPITRHDIMQLAKKLHCRQLAVTSPMRQPTKSNECGLHCILYGCLCAKGLAPLLLTYHGDQTKGSLIDLHEWRGVLANILRNGSRMDDDVPARVREQLPRGIRQKVEALEPHKALQSTQMPCEIKEVTKTNDLTTQIQRSQETVKEGVTKTNVSIVGAEGGGHQGITTRNTLLQETGMCAEQCVKRRNDPYAARVIQETNSEFAANPTVQRTITGKGITKKRGILPLNNDNNWCWANALAQCLVCTLARSEAERSVRDKLLTLLPSSMDRSEQQDAHEALTFLMSTVQYYEKYGADIGCEVKRHQRCDRCRRAISCQDVDLVLFGLEHAKGTIPNERTRPETAKCGQCGAIGSLTLHDEPIKGRRVLVLGTRRFTKETNSAPVKFATDLALDKKRYRLRAVCVYYGNSTRGHYIALVEEEGEIYRTDDTRVSSTGKRSFQDVAEAQQGYLFFYVQVDSDEVPISENGKLRRNTTKEQCDVDGCVVHPKTTDKKKDKPSVVTFGAIRRMLKNTRGYIDVSWSSENDGGRWCGLLTRAIQGNAAQVTYNGTWCQRCEEWHRMKEYELDIPWRGIVYHQVKEITAPSLTQNCTVDSECDSDDGECELRQGEDGARENEAEGDNTDTAWEELGVAESALNTTLPHAVGNTMKGDFGRRWFIHKQKEPGVHVLTWSQMAPSTRRTHITWLERIRAMPSHLADRPFDRALVDLILLHKKERHWKWSTTSNAFANVEAALRDLHLYTNEVQNIKMKEFPYFISSSKRALHLARVTSTELTKADPIKKEKYEEVWKELKVPELQMFMLLLWNFAARAGDMRQVRASDITIGSPKPNGKVPVAILFRFGKGAAFCAPYSIHAVVDKATAQRLQVHCQQRKEGPLFTMAEQQRVAKAVGKVPGCSLRSLRKGAIVHAANSGVSDERLQLFSGHRRRDTLLRYLEWGKYSRAGKEAADERAEMDVQPVGGGVHAMDEIMRPPRMGLRSGYCGKKGRRVQQTPKMFPLKPPSDADLGVQTRQLDTTNWPLHVKNVSTVQWSEVERMAAHTPLAEEVQKAKKWSVSSENYGVTWAPLFPSQVPYSNFTAAQIRTMLDAGKIVPFKGQIRAYVKGFTVTEEEKQRLRPVFEPIINDSCDYTKLVTVHYPSRKERRAAFGRSKFRAQFDFAAYFDQFALSQGVLEFFVLRTREFVDGTNLFAATKEPMGSKFAPGSGQIVTWVITWPIQQAGVEVITMLDNVSIDTDDGWKFVWAVKEFIARCRRAGITLKDADQWSSLSDEEIMKKGSQGYNEKFVFLGEQYEQNTVCNTPKVMKKLERSYQRMELLQDANDEDDKFSRRNFAALCGLIIYMTHTIGHGLERNFSMRRAQAKIASEATSDEKWDEEVRLTDTVRADISSVVGLLMKNVPVQLQQIAPPSMANKDYEVIIIVDASASGWGAYVSFRSKIFDVRRGWSAGIKHSAHSEPIAAKEVIRWVRSRGAKGSIAVVTDHEAMAKAQRRFWNAHGGFSTAWPINDFFAELYATECEAQVFYVEGDKNIADGPSRANRLGQQLRFQEVELQFPDLGTFKHPYAERPKKEVYMC